MKFHSPHIKSQSGAKLFALNIFSEQLIKRKKQQQMNPSNSISAEGLSIAIHPDPMSVLERFTDAPGLLTKR